MGLTYQMKMKIPFDMADMNGHNQDSRCDFAFPTSFRDAVY